MGKHGTLLLGLLAAHLFACADDEVSPDGGTGDSGAPDDAAATPPDAGPDAEPDASVAEPGVIVTHLGALRGRREGDTYVFRGVPFAAPPIGELRWRMPAPAAAWEGVRDAFDFGPICTQVDWSLAVVGGEDCLTLNVWAPANPPAAPLPVMVYLHGGDNIEGAGSLDVYDGRTLSEMGGVVVVTVNYRLGAFGFLAHPAFATENEHGSTGNYGIADQIAALRWVAEDIAAFGGDPSRVMVFGQSAGASDTCTLLGSPLAAGLFSRALMQSLNCDPQTSEVVDATVAAVEEAFDCRGAGAAACLRGKSAEEIARGPGGALTDQTGADFYVTVDGYIVPEDPVEAIRAGRHNAMPIIAGTTADEYSQIIDLFLEDAFPTGEEYLTILTAWFGELADDVAAAYPVDAFASARAALVEIISDLLMHCPTRRVLRAAAAGQDEPVFRYLYGHGIERGPLARYGAAHGTEVDFVFHNFVDFEPTAAERALADDLVGAWTRFAATGDPNGPDAFAWPAYDTATDPYVLLDTTFEEGAGVHTTACDFWETVE